MTDVLPNCIYIGPGKTGSTWLFEFFRFHSDVYVTPAKDLYFFDQFFERGLDWYSKQFSGARSERIIAEICHDYIVSNDAPERIANALPGVKLMMFVREPVERTFSAYLYRLKHGIYSGTFEDALVDRPEIFESSLYAKYVRIYAQYFPIDDILVFAFDDLKNDPQGFADQICCRLGIDQIELPDAMLKPALRAARARSLPVAKSVKKAALLARQLGLVNLVAKIKTNRIVQQLLYRDYSKDNSPAPPTEIASELRTEARTSVHELDELLGSDFCGRWGY